MRVTMAGAKRPEDEHEEFVRCALDEFPGSGVAQSISSVEIYRRILSLAEEAAAGCGAVPVQCPRCQGASCPKCDGGRVGFGAVRQYKSARMEIVSRVLTIGETCVELRDRYWLRAMRDSIAVLASRQSAMASRAENVGEERIVHC